MFDAAEFKGSTRKHELEVIDGVARMAYVEATIGTPWHGLGVPVDASISREEMLVKAGLDHEIQKRRLYVRTSEIAGSGLYNIPKQFAIMRKDDNQYYGVVSDRYQVVQNKEVMDFFTDYVDAGGMTLATAGSLKNGGVVWVMARIGKDFTLPGGDRVEGNMLLANSHDGTMQYQGMFTSTDVVCYNTLSIALNANLEIEKNGANKMFKMKHSKKMTTEVMQDAKVKMGLAVTRFDRLKEWSHSLSEKKVKDEQHVLQYIAELVHPELLEQVVELTAADRDIALATGGSLLDTMIEQHPYLAPKTLTTDDFNRAGKAILGCIMDSPGQELAARKGTWWGVLNGVTRYVDHEAGRGRDTALQSAWFGQGNQLKQQAAQLAVSYGGR